MSTNKFWITVSFENQKIKNGLNPWLNSLNLDKQKQEKVKRKNCV